MKAGHMRGSTVAAIVGGCLLALAAGELLHAALAAPSGRERRAGMGVLAEQLGLTDTALFTEARYTRHRSLADLHSAFQDAPMAIDHFPAGSLAPPPRDFPKAELRAGTGD
jgi:hypothetical protein